MPLIINTDECDRCGTCISVCPCNALLLTEVVSVEDEKCTSCSSCVIICPIGAIKLT